MDCRLPDAIGELHALTELLLVGSRLTTLPDTIGGLKPKRSMCTSVAGRAAAPSGQLVA